MTQACFSVTFIDSINKQLCTFIQFNAAAMETQIRMFFISIDRQGNICFLLWNLPFNYFGNKTDINRLIETLVLTSVVGQHQLLLLSPFSVDWALLCLSHFEQETPLHS